jgi:uncharacterized membrane protein
VPGGVAAFAWASTLSVSSYWAHPGALLSFPTAELAWMAVSPVALILLVTGAAATIRRADLSPRLRYEALLARVTAIGMLTFLTGACAWVMNGGPGPRNLFHAGTIDMAGIIVMVATLAVSYRAIGRARDGSLGLLQR